MNSTSSLQNDLQAERLILPDLEEQVLASHGSLDGSDLTAPLPLTFTLTHLILSNL